MHTAIKEIISKLETRQDLPQLTPRFTWNAALEQDIETLRQLPQNTAMITLIAALHLRNDSLDTSHSYAQQIEHDPTGAYWHGIMHRMEEDYWNAKYWFKRADKHPISKQLTEKVAIFLQQNWDSIADEQNQAILHSFQNKGWNSGQFVDLVQSSSPSIRPLLEQIQAIEIEELFHFTLEQVVQDVGNSNQ